MNNNEQRNEDYKLELKGLSELLTELRKLIEDDTDEASEAAANFTAADFLSSPLQIGIRIQPDGDKQKIGLMVKIDQRLTSSDVAAFCFHISLATDKLMKDYVIDRAKGNNVEEFISTMKKNAADKYSNFKP